MALQWVILGCVVAAEAVVALLLTLPLPRLLRRRLVALVSLILQPAVSVVFFAAFQLLDLYWKKENRLRCASDHCTLEERLHFDKAIFKAQRNAVLCAAACFLYWFIYRICNYIKRVYELEELEKREKGM